jgi:2-polyprenyl-3-methyl-5-hydroxy-6-metoxy-1,4-benzoquinol methylase
LLLFSLNAKGICHTKQVYKVNIGAELLGFRKNSNNNGRTLSLVNTQTMRLKQWISFFRRKVVRIKKDRWDYQYRQGQWEELNSANELYRVQVATELLKKYHRRNNILEIGCGEGIFYRHIPPEYYRHYEGVDISEVAIKKINPLPRSTFTVGDMENFEPGHFPFDTIVLNEVIYYSKDPVKLLERYKPFLAGEGVFLVGMFQMSKSRKIWDLLHLHFTVLETITITAAAKEWTYKILK